MEINEFILPAVALCSYCVCYIFAGVYPDKKRFTPLLAAVVGVVAALAVATPVGVSAIANTVISGMVSGLAATGAWESYKNILKKEG